MHSELYSHIPLIPLVSLFVFYTKREQIKSTSYQSFWLGIPVIIAGTLLFLTGKTVLKGLELNDHLSIMMAGFVTCLLGGFLLFYGADAFWKALFPLLFLGFMIPIPRAILDPFILFLQRGSADVAEMLFKGARLPFFRDGFVFALPNITIEVAKECSGIRSSIAMVITSILAAQFFLQTGWKKGLLVLAIIPITIFKNGVRILTLSLLAVYVDTKFITNSSLHKEGGILFYIFGLVLLVPVLWGLRKLEKKNRMIVKGDQVTAGLSVEESRLKIED